MNTNGLTRPLSARTGKYNYQRQTINESNLPTLAYTAAVSYSGAAATQKFLDMYEDTLQGVCGGIPQLFVNGLGILTTDTADGENGSFRMYWEGYLNILASDTPAVGDLLYWDAGNSRLTTTASTHKAVGQCQNATLVTVATATLGSLPVGTWVHIYLKPTETV